MLSEKFAGFPGPAIEVSQSYGGTSGRFAVAKLIARIFPKNRAFVRSVIQEGIMSEDGFPTGPYPSDTLKYKTDRMVEFTTVANLDGLGTGGALKRRTQPISGAVILAGEYPDAFHLSMRLPKGLEDLGKTVIYQFDQDAIQAN